MAQRIELIARGIVRHGDYVLLCKAKKGGYLFLPGGHVEFGEAAAVALAREFLEECGLRVRVGSLCAVSEGSFDQDGKRRHEVNLVFHVELNDEGYDALREVPSLEKQIEFVWMPMKDVSRSDIRPATAKAFLSKGASDISWEVGI